MAKNNNDGLDDATIMMQAPKGEAPKAALVCNDDDADSAVKGLEIVLDVAEQTIGRSASNSVRLNYKELSREHARIVPGNGAWVVEDLQSLNGVYVNDARIARPTQLKHGDIVRFGNFSFRYTLKHPLADGSPTVPTAHSRAEGTMYAGHVGVLGALARPEEALGGVPESVPVRRSEPLSKRVGRYRKKNKIKRERRRGAGGLLRYGLLAVFLVGLAGGGYWYLKDISIEEMRIVEKEYIAEFQRFIDVFEGESGTASAQSSDLDISEIRNISARVDLAAKKYPSSSVLRVLQSKLLFLEFERKLNGLLNAGKIDQAESLIDRVSDVLDTLANEREWQGETAASIREVRDLVELAKVIVQFKLFRQRFPDPANHSLGKPTKHDIKEMQRFKHILVKKKDDNNLVLSVTYTYFHRMVADVDENDVRLVNRWKEVLRRENAL